MKHYYLFAQTKEIVNYVSKSLENYAIEVIHESGELFDIDQSDAVLMFHVNSYEGESTEFIQYLLQEKKGLKILALSSKIDFLEGTALLQAGVEGYGNVYMHGVLLNQAIEVIQSGNMWIYPELTHHLIKNLKKNETKNEAALDELSKHEKECALLAADGSSNKEIAQLLDLQEITIKKHLSSAYKKLGLKNRIELALFINQSEK